MEHTTEQPLFFTPAAIQKIFSLISEAKNNGEVLIADPLGSTPPLSLRVFVQGGGCSGFKYGFAFDEKPAGEDDFSLFFKVPLPARSSGPKTEDPDLPEAYSDDHTDKRVSVLVDSMSLQYLQNAEIDFQENLDGAQFVVKNPHAKTSCGCGSSFSV